MGDKLELPKFRFAKHADPDATEKFVVQCEADEELVVGYTDDRDEAQRLCSKINLISEQMGYLNTNTYRVRRRVAK